MALLQRAKMICETEGIKYSESDFHRARLLLGIRLFYEISRIMCDIHYSRYFIKFAQ
jgi:hypothetical protein